MMVSFKTCKFYTQIKDFLIPVYIFNGRKQTLVDTSGYCQCCACVVCMTSASSWPNCVSRVARITNYDYSWFNTVDLDFVAVDGDLSSGL